MTIWSRSLFIFLLSCSPTTTKPSPLFTPEEEAVMNFSETEVTFQNQENLTLCGSFIVPKRDHKGPAALFIVGTGDYDRSEVLVLQEHLIELLTKNGIASLIVDKRGCGKSQGQPGFMNHTLNESVEDARAAIAFLTSQEKIDPTKIGIIGHSEGTVIAPVVKATSETVSFIVLLAPIALPGIATQLAQRNNIPEEVLRCIASGATEAEVMATLKSIIKEKVAPTAEAEQKLIAQLAEQGVIIENYDQFFDLSMNSPLPEESLERFLGLTTCGDAIKGMVSPHNRSMLAHDPRPYLNRLNIPALAIFAERDSLCSFSAHGESLRQACPNAIIKIISELCNESLRTLHGFKVKKDESESCSGANEAVSQELLQLVLKWVLEKTTT